MLAVHLMQTPDQPLPYCVVARRDGAVVRLRPVSSVGEGNLLLARIMREEREYEAALRAEVTPYAERSADAALDRSPAGSAVWV